MKAKNDSVKSKGSRKRILFLGGSGKMDRGRARELVASDLVSEVGIAGRNLERLNRAVTKIGNKAHAVQVDILDEHRLVSVAADYDIILNTAGPEYEVLLPALRGAITAGKHYCDIGGDGPTVGDACLGQGLADSDDHGVIHVAAEERMGMADGSSGRGSGGGLVEDALEG